MKVPFIPPEIISFLDDIYKTSKVKDIKDLGDLRQLQGQLEVVDFLRSHSERQQRDGNILNHVQTPQGGAT